MVSTYSDSDIAAAAEFAGRKLGFELTEKQLLVVRKFVRGQDVFVWLPTGSGKSLCFFVLPWAWTFDRLRGNDTACSVIIVVSPLIALMKEQVEAVTKKGMTALYVGDIDKDDDDLVASVNEGKYQVLYFSPEALLRSEGWRDLLMSSVYKKNVVGFIVDEAHCVKKWGEKFRKEFGLLGEVCSLLADGVHVMALTATATNKCRRSICNTLGMINPAIISDSPNKPNIKYIVEQKSSTIAEAFAPVVEELRTLRTSMDKVMVFCRTYSECTQIFMYIKKKLHKEYTDPIRFADLARFRLVDMFTACTHPSVKDSIVHSFCNPESCLRVVIATVAFGMGMNRPNVRRIIHWGPPEDVESYLQETGRAGCDGLPAQAILYYGGRDMSRFHVTDNMKDYCKLRGKCRREFLLKDFDESNQVSVPSKCMCCDNCSVMCNCIACK